MCGTERWLTKELIDPDRSKIDFNDTISATILEQVSLPQPSLIKVTRLPLEDSLIQVECFIAGYKVEADGDFHIVITDGNKYTMIAEIGDINCSELKKSTHYKEITVVRLWFDDTFHPTSKYKLSKTKTKYRFTGVRFFDKIHGQTGVAPNGVEIHQCLKIEKIQ